MSTNTIVSIRMFLLLGMIVICQAVDTDAVRGQSNDWFPSKSNFSPSKHKTFFDIFRHVPGRSRSSNAVCMPKVFQENGYEPTSSFSTALYYDGNGTRVASHTMMSSSFDMWDVAFYHPDSHTADSYSFNKTACQYEKIEVDFPEACLPDGAKLNRTFTVGLPPDAVKVNLWIEESSTTQFLVTAKENLPVVVSDSGEKAFTVYYYDASLTVDDSVFVLPSYCPKPHFKRRFN